MRRTNGSLFWLALVSCILGLLMGSLGWCLYQPQQAASLGHGINAYLRRVLAGPFATSTAPNMSQILAYAWSETSGAVALVFMAFWVTGSLIFYWVFEWSSRPR